ncbi:serine/threonine-protein phosphatase 4 regulatory subunit 2-A-like [Varroa jacobsoni]|uniref:serine/threonine-protein phosphatase 4 regulatory subunit 2-A-like n=1 Tax=Varroa jacobsoni TaxID=62625 RepID=UPI000BF6ED42|nr:serine/threonine-protein phosphatase 4 regulatory subunit 2-A-like [Varroa jacobsoni]
MREKILEALEYFTQAPFTIQRLCEVMVEPKKYYKRIDKLMRAIEKNLLVTTTVDPRRPASPNGETAQASGVVNGYDERANGHHPAGLRGVSGVPEGAQLNADAASAGLDEEEPMDITGPPAPQPHAVLDCPAEAMEGCEDESGEDIDVDQDNPQPTDNPSHGVASTTGSGIANTTSVESDGHNRVQQQLDNSNSGTSGGVAGANTSVQETGATAAQSGAGSGGGGSSQENLLHIQQQMREQQQQQQLMAMTGFDAASTTTAAGVNKTEGSAAGSGGIGSKPGPIAMENPPAGLGSGTGQAGPGAALNDEDSCSDVEAEGEGEQDMILMMMRGSRGESGQDNELEQQVPQFGSCESGESGGLSPVQFQNVSSQSSQDAKKENQTQQHRTSSLTTRTNLTSESTTPTAAGSQGSPSGSQSSLVESSQQLQTDGDSNTEDTTNQISQNNEAKSPEPHQEQDKIVKRATSRSLGNSEALALSGGDQNGGRTDENGRVNRRGQTTLMENTEEGSIGQSSSERSLSVASEASVSRLVKIAGSSSSKTNDAETGEQVDLDPTGSPPKNEAIAK